MKNVTKQNWSLDTKEIIECISEIRFDKLPPMEERTMSNKAWNKILIDATKIAIKTLYRNNINLERLQKATKEARGIYYKAFVDLYGTRLTY